MPVAIPSSTVQMKLQFLNVTSTHFISSRTEYAQTQKKISLLHYLVFLDAINARYMGLKSFGTTCVSPACTCLVQLLTGYQLLTDKDRNSLKAMGVTATQQHRQQTNMSRVTSTFICTYFLSSFVLLRISHLHDDIYSPRTQSTTVRNTLGV